MCDSRRGVGVGCAAAGMVVRCVDVSALRWVGVGACCCANGAEGCGRAEEDWLTCQSGRPVSWQ